MSFFSSAKAKLAASEVFVRVPLSLFTASWETGVLLQRSLPSRLSRVSSTR